MLPLALVEAVNAQAMALAKISLTFAMNQYSDGYGCL